MSSILGMGTKTKYLSTAPQTGKDLKDRWYGRRSSGSTTKLPGFKSHKLEFAIYGINLGKFDFGQT